MKGFFKSLFKFKKRESIPPEMVKLGKLFRKCREELGMSIREVSTKAELAPSYLCKLETGDTFKSIGIENLLRLAKFYKLPMETLLKEAGFIENSGNKLPEFSSYLRSKYHYPSQEVREMEMALELTMKKYNVKP